MLREAGIKEGFTEALLARNGFQKDTLRAVRVILSDEGTLKGKGVEGVGEKVRQGSGGCP